jgi:hypothetical protein
MPSLKNLKPIVKVTEKQWKGILERVLSKEGGIKPQALQSPIEGMAPREPINFGQQSGPIQPASVPQYGTSPIDELTQAVEPIDKTMGRLYRPSEVPGVNKPLDYPWAEARLRSIQDSTLIPENNPRMPPTTRLRTVNPMSPENLANPNEFAKGLAYERLNWKPIESQGEKVSRAFVAQAMEEAGVKAAPEQIADTASIFSDLWKSKGGMRSEHGKHWEQLRSTSRLKESIPDAKSYFLKSATHWKESPETFSRQFPREAKRLSESWIHYMEGK